MIKKQIEQFDIHKTELIDGQIGFINDLIGKGFSLEEIIIELSEKLRFSVSKELLYHSYKKKTEGGRIDKEIKSRITIKVLERRTQMIHMEGKSEYDDERKKYTGIYNGKKVYKYYSGRDVW